MTRQAIKMARGLSTSLSMPACCECEQVGRVCRRVNHFIQHAHGERERHGLAMNARHGIWHHHHRRGMLPHPKTPRPCHRIHSMMPYSSSCAHHKGREPRWMEAGRILSLELANSLFGKAVGDDAQSLITRRRHQGLFVLIWCFWGSGCQKSMDG